MLGGLPTPRSAAAAVLLVLGFGCLVGAAVGPDASTSLASRRAITVVAAAPPPAVPEPALAAEPPANPAVDASPAPADAPLEPVPEAPAPAAPAAPQTPAEKAPAAPAPKVPPIAHVAVISLSGQGYDAAFGPESSATYLSQELPARGALLRGYRAVTDGGLANGIAMISGQAPNPQTAGGCPSYVDVADGAGCVYPAAVQTLPGQMSEVGRTWKAYLEDADRAPTGEPATCRHPAPGAPDPTGVPRPGDAYANQRNPFVYFHAISDTPDCAANDVPLTQLDADLQAPDAFPNLAWIVPNLCHDGRDTACPDPQPTGLAAADAFVRTWAEKLLAAPAFKDGLLIVTFDSPPEGAPDHRVGAVLISHWIKGGTALDAPYDHLGLLRTIEDVFGVAHLAGAADRAVSSFGDDVFTAWR